MGDNLKINLKVNNEALFMQAYPYIVRIHCFIIHFTLSCALNLNLEMVCTMNFFCFAVLYRSYRTNMA